ncbi:MAG: tetratricopeptide repeat protein [Pseudomonadota bacterium]
MSSKLSAEKIQSIFSDSVQKLQQGNAAGAQKGLEKVARAIPHSVAVWYNLALSQQHLGLHTKAIDSYRRVLKLDSSNPDPMVNLGLSYKELNQISEARKCAQKALALDPKHSRALNLVATIDAEENNAESALETLRRVVKDDPDNFDARHNLANLLTQTGDHEAALETAESLLQQPKPAKHHRELVCQIFLDLKRYGDASHVLKSLKDDFADDLQVQLLEITLGELIKDYFRVIDVAHKVLEKEPELARAWNSLGSAYFQLDSIAKAKDSYFKASALDPEHPEYLNNLGLSHSSTGDKDEAEKCYRKALSLNPTYAEAYRNLVAMKKFKSMDDADASAIEDFWQKNDQDDFTRTKLAFAIGKVYDDVGEYEQAFEAYDEGNRLKFAEAKLDFDQYFSHIDGVIDCFDDRPDEVSEAIPEHQPIFILGMPRSGTTLVEQIISRHPEVTGCGELPCIEKAISRLEKKAEPMRVYPQDFLQLDSEALTGETMHYLSWVDQLHDMQTPYFTDKMPFNFVHVWLIKALFPTAGIAHCHRHPLDVITSNYFQLYASDISFVYNLEILARYYLRYQRLMHHWHEVFPGEIHTIQYEALVSNKDEETRRLIDGVGLRWDDACLDLKKSDTAVRTASIWQVRQGIYTSSKERWRNYSRQLQPAIDILQEEGVLDADLNYIP